MDNFSEFLPQLVEAMQSEITIDMVEQLAEDPDSVDDDSFAETLLIVAALFLLYQVKINKEAKRIGKLNGVAVTAASPAILRQAQKWVEYFQTVHLTDSIKSIKKVSTKLKLANVSTRTRQRILKQFAGVTKKKSDQMFKAMQKMVDGGKTTTEIIAEMSRRNKSFVNQQTNLMRTVEGTRAKELGKKSAVQSIKKPNQTVWKIWDSTLDSKTTETCQNLNGERVKGLNGVFSSGQQMPPSFPPVHYCRSRIIYYLQNPDGTEQPIKL
ncbi:hypothetical protein [Endozoicomonas sp. ALB115]|uniref:hypothetical protein n=1 Tax=Endozoicomonas sp. ALB115 TaxID=3403074 RepID=UPI003BB779D8